MCKFDFVQVYVSVQKIGPAQVKSFLMFLKWSFFTKHLLEIHNSYIILSFRIRIRMKWAVCKLVVVQVCAPVQKKFGPTCPGPAQVKKCGNGTTCTTCTTYLPLDGSVGTLIFNSFHNITSVIGSLLAELWIQHRTRPVWFKYDNWLFQLTGIFNEGQTWRGICK